MQPIAHSFAMATAVAEIVRLFEAKQVADPTRLIVRNGEFAEEIWAAFNPSLALKYLLATKLTFPGHKETLFKAFSAWVIAPKDEDLIKSAISFSNLAFISAGEAAALKDLNQVAGIAADALGRHGYMGEQFLREIYYPCGGIMGIGRHHSRDEFNERIASHSWKLEYALKVLEIAHYHVTELLPGGRHGVPSLYKSSRLMKELGVSNGSHKTPPAERAMRGYWADHRQSIAFAYSARTIVMPDGRSLLQAITDGRGTYDDARGILTEWISRARFVATFILDRGSDREMAADTLSTIPTTDEVPFDPPHFSETAKQSIGRMYKRG